MDTRYEYTISLFRKINPDKKYARFTYSVIESLNDLHIYMNKDEIVEYNGIYYQYKGDKSYTSTEPRKSFIQVKHNNTVVHSYIH